MHTKYFVVSLCSLRPGIASICLLLDACNPGESLTDAPYFYFVDFHLFSLYRRSPLLPLPVQALVCSLPGILLSSIIDDEIVTVDGFVAVIHEIVVITPAIKYFAAIIQLQSPSLSFIFLLDYYCFSQLANTNFHIAKMSTQEPSTGSTRGESPALASDWVAQLFVAAQENDEPRVTPGKEVVQAFDGSSCAAPNDGAVSRKGSRVSFAKRDMALDECECFLLLCSMP